MKDKILHLISKPNYTPVKPRALARKLGITDADYGDFRRALKDLLDAGKVTFGASHQVKPAGGKGPALLGTFRRAPNGHGYVRPHPVDGQRIDEIPVLDGREMDASSGDEVQFTFVRKQDSRSRFAAVVRVLERATRQFVGAYHERDGDGLVRVDNAVFSRSIYVGDPGAKGAKPEDKVVIEMIRFPSVEDRGEAVISEVLGQQGAPGVDTLSVIRTHGLPDQFSEDVLEESRQAAADFNERDIGDREDLTGELIITIDPVDARDFDDAISLTRDAETGHWDLGVHIADVGHFARPGGALDQEARSRGTSAYLPQKVIPMFPEIISNGLASLQEGRVRFTKSVFIELTPQGQTVSTRFANTAIKNKKRYTYEQVSAFYDRHDAKKEKPSELNDLLLRMRELALVLRKRRQKKGALELSMPEPVLEYNDAGKVSGAHFAVNDISHQVIEEFMLAANVAVAQKLDELEVPFLRRIHPPPDELKLKAFSEFVRSLGYKLDRHVDRFGLQKVLERAADRPDMHAVNYAMLRSFKQATYSAYEDEHYALAFKDYCHFTSPIRRYPDLTVHRLIDRWLKHRKVTADMTETLALGDHCSKMERRAEAAERELVKLRLLDYMSERIGESFDAVITGVADYGFFAQGVKLPVEGRVHISTLTDDYYLYDGSLHTLTGRRTKKRYRLGDPVHVEVVRVDLTRRQLDIRVADEKKAKKSEKQVKQEKPKRDKPSRKRRRPE